MIVFVIGCERMHEGSMDLIAAVCKAADNKLDATVYSDRMMMQKGCYILNSWGYGPQYDYEYYVKGPFSVELDDDYISIGNNTGNETEIPYEAIARLSEIMRRGRIYTEIYSIVLLLKDSNPDASSDSIRNRAMDLRPNMRGMVEEVSASLLK